MHRRSGFTLIEILVVIVIIGILTSLTIVGVSAALESARRSKTDALIRQLAGQCEQYKTRWGSYPPSSLAQIGGPVPNETNNGAEALCACLGSKTRGDHFLGTIETGQFSNTDNDSASRNITNWFFGDNQLREICDAWGQPITYLHNLDYKAAQMNIRKYLFADGTEQVVPIIVDPNTKTFLRDNSFQMQSAGKDGKFGTEDDIKAP